MKNELDAIRLIAITEGISLLLLLFVAVPAKRLYDFPILVSWIGAIHGILFLMYVAALILWRSSLNWSWPRVLVATIAASVPFAIFFPRFHAPLTLEPVPIRQ